MSDSMDLRTTLTTLKAEQGLTPTLLLIESVFHHPDSGSTQNTHISFYVRLAWEREGLVYEPHHLKQFLSPSGWSQVLKAHENGEFELEATGKLGNSEVSALRISRSPLPLSRPLHRW